MDILTPLGQRTLQDEQVAASIWERNFPDFKYVQTPKDKPATVDALLIRNNVIEYAVETKCRYDMDLGVLDDERNGEWLVTYDKLLKAAQIAAGLGVPLIGFLYLVPDKLLLAKKLTNEKGNFIVNVRVEKTHTQQTVNGGRIERVNAYVDMKDCKLLK
jgi:hypothetical protein